MQDFFLSYGLTDLLTSKTLRSTYLAYPVREPEQKVIVKIFDKECAGKNQEESSLRADALMALKHTHIIPTLEIATDEQGKPYVVSEYRSHGSLRQRLNRLSSEHMDWQEAINITIQIGQALSYCHEQQVTHGNIKPENIFYNDDGEVQITDFSLAPFVDTTKLEYKADMYTTKYMAPEQFVGKIDPQSDQYALACVAYELISGHTPFEAQNFSALWGKHATEFASSLSAQLPKLPMSVDLAILKALAKNPKGRYPNIDAFLTSLAAKVAFHSTSISSAFFSSGLTGSSTPLPIITNDPFFTELANRTFTPLTYENTPPTQDSGPLPSAPAVSKSPSPANSTSYASLPDTSTSGTIHTALPPEVALPKPSTSSGIRQRKEESKKSSSLHNWERHPRLDSQERTTASLPIPTPSIHTTSVSIPSIPTSNTPTYINTPSTFDATQSAKMESLHGHKAQGITLSDKQILVEVSTVARQKNRRRNYLVGICILFIAIILGGLFLPSLFTSKAKKAATASLGNAGTLFPESTAVQSGPYTPTPTIIPVKQPGKKGTTRTANNSIPGLPPAGKDIPTIPTIPTIKNPIPQPTAPANVPVPVNGPVPVPTHSPSNIPPPPPPPVPPKATATPVSHGVGSVRIDAGGSGAGAFIADTNYVNTTPGRPSTNSRSSSRAIDISGVSNPAPLSVYQSNRVGDCLYTISNLTPQASYTVRLHFAESYWNAAGKRTFDVIINSQLALSNFDIFAAAGSANKAVVEGFVVPADNHGSITIQFATLKDNAQINAIEVLAV